MGWKVRIADVVSFLPSLTGLSDGRTPFKIVDTEGRVIGLLAGRPADPAWDNVASEAYAAMARAAKEATFSAKQKLHDRGNFATLAVGVSFGGGRTVRQCPPRLFAVTELYQVPGRVDNTPAHQKILSALCANPAIRRLAGFGSGEHVCTGALYGGVTRAAAMLSTYAPRIFERTQLRLKALCARHPSLRFNFDNSVYPATSFNFGPATVCVDHTDSANDACNWCHIVALGRFDCDKRGQIVFPDMKLAVRFPHGASIHIPSAIVRHGNTPIGPGEERMSMTQYCAGGLLRWVECGFRTVKTLEKEDPPAHQAYLAGLGDRMRASCELFERVRDVATDMSG